MSTTKEKFRFSAPVLIAILIALVLQIVLSLRMESGGEDDPYRYTGLVSRSAVTILLPLGLAALAWRVTGRRPIVGMCTGVLVALALALVATLGLVRAEQKRDNAAVLEEAREANQQTVQEVERRPEDPVATDVTDTNTSAIAVERFRQIASQSSGLQNRLFKSMIPVYEAMVPVEQAYDDVAAIIDTEGSWDVSDVETIQELRERMEVAQRLEATAERLADDTRTLPERLKARMIEDGISEENARVSTAPLVPVQEKAAVTIQLDVEYAQLLQEMFRFYIDRWDAWGYDTEQELMLFESDEDVEKFKEFMARIDDINRRSLQASQDLFKLQQGISGGG